MPASPRSRIDTLPLIAGSAVLDLVNTISWRGAPDRQQDHLGSAADCLTWATRVRAITSTEHEALRQVVDSDQTAAEALLHGLRDLRRTIAELVQQPWPATPSAAVRAAILDALTHSDLLPARDSTSGSSPGFRWAVSAIDEHTPRRRLALELQALLTAPISRIGVCADRDCGWVFLDTSRGQNRRWCSSADCGNRHRVQQHHRREVRSVAPR